MTYPLLMTSRADASGHFLPPTSKAAWRAEEAGEIDRSPVSKPWRQLFASRRQPDCAARFGAAIVRWSDVAYGWLFMIVASAALLGWATLWS